MKKTDLPGPEALTIPGGHWLPSLVIFYLNLDRTLLDMEGKKPGDVKMIRNGNNVEAHQGSPRGSYTLSLRS